MVDAGGDAFRDLAAVFREAKIRFRTADKNDLRSAHGSGFIHGAAVVVKGGLAFIPSETAFIPWSSRRARDSARERPSSH
jgi:hypothetical protein